MRKISLFLPLVWTLTGLQSVSARVDPAPAAKPNIVYILADDLGYGDVHCLNFGCKIATPNIDRLATEGMIFTDAHSSDSVCTPSRYGILTGRYAWRTRLQHGVLQGFSPPLIEKGRMTVASLLRDHGYSTVAYGKWHLGMDWAKKAGRYTKQEIRMGENIDYAKPIADGPTTDGFDSFYGIAASLDMWPFMWINDDHAVGVPPVVIKTFKRRGPAAKGFEAVDVLPTITKKACEYIAAHAIAAKSGKPFFIYLALPSPHTPLVPDKQWQGKSVLGPYGDYVMETDWSVGKVMSALKRTGLAKNTLLFFASDNGVAPYVGVGPKQLKELEAKGYSVKKEERSFLQRYKELEAMGQYSSYIFRGHKADIWEGGHRVPFIVRWPGKVKPGSKTKQLSCLADLMATCADILHTKLPADAGEDSVSMLPVLLGTAKRSIQKIIVNHSVNGSFAIRDGNWTLELCPGSGGWGYPGPRYPHSLNDLPSIQLYNLRSDIGEKKNLEAQYPNKVRHLRKLLEWVVDDGRSTPGAPQKNDVKVIVK